ncbi:MAG: type II toxin-antitoxin system VapC family toxin [Aggregatilineales bacterium]
MTIQPTPVPVETAYVVDTNALFWYLTGAPRLTAKAKAVFVAAEQGQTRLYVSVISLAELFYMLQKKPLPQSFAQLYAVMKAKPYFEYVGLEPEQILEFTEDSVIPEMHDRVIVGLARRLRAPLITSDGPITAANHVKIVW